MKILFLFLCSVITITVNAQQFRIGAQLSPQISFWKVEGDLYERLDNKIGVQAGLILDQTLGSSERFALTTGLNLNMAPGGFRETDNNNDPDIRTWQFNVMSLDLPLTVRLRSDQIKKSVFYAQYGVTLGFTLSAVPKNDDGQAAGGFEYEGMNTSLTMGLGMERELESERMLLLGLFFQNGIVNVLIDNANDDNMFPQQLGIRAGMFF